MSETLNSYGKIVGEEIGGPSELRIPLYPYLPAHYFVIFGGLVAWNCVFGMPGKIRVAKRDSECWFAIVCLPHSDASSRTVFARKEFTIFLFVFGSQKEDAPKHKRQSFMQTGEIWG